MPLPYDLGEMKSETGEVLRYEVEAVASDMAIGLARALPEYPLYRQIIKEFPSPSTPLYFEKTIKSEIYPIARDICVFRWRKRNGVEAFGSEDVLCVPAEGIFTLLEKTWNDETISLRFVSPSFRERFESSYRGFRAVARETLNRLWSVYYRCRYKKIPHECPEGNGVIALQFVEGIDLRRRSDIVWHPESGVDPERILIYFDSPDSEPINEDIVKEIEALGMRWVCLDRRSTKVNGFSIWYPSYGEREKITLPDQEGYRPTSKVERWIYRTGRTLCRDVSKWVQFYRAFNVRIHFFGSDGSQRQIAQRIAFESKNSVKGIMAGKQRSELHWPSLSALGRYPFDVYFTWSPRAEQYLSPNVNRIITNVSTGYPNDLVFKQKRMDAKQARDSLRSHGADFTIALFDNVHGPDIGYSTAKMERFYLAFLEWLLEDETLGILIKSKKPSVLQRLPRVLPVLEKAEGTGRCIRLENEFGRLPVDVSLACDISVGIGISSAVIEAAIAGCRGIQCDLSFLRSHEFYQWGSDRIIFDDQKKLLSAMKEHKSLDPGYVELGDWSPFVDRLDPFRDGRAGERMGTYLRWCLEGFDDGLNRDEVIRRANEKYNSLWGADKAVLLPMSHETVNYV